MVAKIRTRIRRQDCTDLHGFNTRGQEDNMARGLTRDCADFCFGGIWIRIFYGCYDILIFVHM